MIDLSSIVRSLCLSPSPNLESDRLLGAALAGIIANGLGFEQMTHTAQFQSAAFWLFAGFVPPALLGTLIAWRFGNRIGTRAMS